MRVALGDAAIRREAQRQAEQHCRVCLGTGLKYQALNSYNLVPCHCPKGAQRGIRNAP